MRRFVHVSKTTTYVDENGNSVSRETVQSGDGLLHEDRRREGHLEGGGKEVDDREPSGSTVEKQETTTITS